MTSSTGRARPIVDVQVRELPLGKIVAAGSVVTVVVAVAVGAIVWPVLQRVDRTASLIEESLPILQAIGPEVSTIEQNVDTLTPQISSVGPGLTELDGRIEDLESPLLRLEARIAELQGSLSTLDELPALRSDLRDGLGTISTELAETNASLRSVRDDFSVTTERIGQLTDAVTRLVEQFEQVVALLDETEQHVENLDRKTGPAPPGEQRTAR